jgi:UDP-GlcNAc3NAcA epimerase
MLALLDKCRSVLTDSGRWQKEAFFLKKKCVTLRDQTEWVELVECGCNLLAGNRKSQILDSFRNIKNSHCDFEQKLYGDGQAAEIIVSAIMDYCGE